jgi:HD-GYP domain-containing protein (c-di-GMP phosphodiesterase class II)
LSCALDLTEGQAMGHAIRTCIIGLRIADVLGLSCEERDQLYLATLLKDAGCSSNAARMVAIFGCDDIEAKFDGKICDWCRVSEAVRYAARHTLPGASPARRLAKLAALMRLRGRAMHLLTEARCTQGADVARLLGLGEAVAQAIYSTDEHWDGQGAAQGLRGEEIPLLARIVCLSQTVEVYATTFGVPAAFSMIRERSGRWFDPELAHAAEAFESDDAFWDEVKRRPRARLAEDVGPALRRSVTAASVDAVCAAFARIIDAKAAFTAAHSARVASYAVHIGRNLSMDAETCADLHRAGLLHDLGKLGVPNRILDKPDSLTDAEFAVIRRHPRYTEQVLSRIPSFERVTVIAAAHHERLDGSGYFRGKSGIDLTLPMRVLAVADVFDALTADRPYRASLTVERAIGLLESDAARGKLDRDVIAALREDPPNVPSGTEPAVSRIK